MKNTYEIKLFNRKFHVKSDSDEKHVQKVADYVNKTIFDIKENTPSVSSVNVALLASLNIADEFFKLKKNKSDDQNKAKNKVKELIELVDEYLNTKAS